MNGVLDGLGNDGHKKEPKNLKEALNFLAALSENTELTAQIAERLKQEAAKYLLEDKLTTGSYAITPGLTQVLDAVITTREAIVNELKKRDYGIYNDLSHDNNCADRCVAILLQLLPKLHATLYYLYFRAGTTLGNQIGADWSMYKCNDDTEDLCKWFTDRISSRVFGRPDAKLLPGGYTGPDELRDTNGHILGGELGNFVDPEAADGYLQKLLFTLSFNISLSRASTAAAVSCIDAFCKAVIRGYFNGDNEYKRRSSQLTSICAALPDNLKPLTGGSYGRKFLESTFQDSEKDLVDILGHYAYRKYVVSLKDKIPMLISFLDEMQKECAKWNPSSIHHREVVGPFVYGFTFGNRWRRGGSIYEIGPQLVNDIAKLTGKCTSVDDGTLVALWKCLHPTSSNCPVQSASVVSTTVIHETRNEETPSTAASPAAEKRVEPQRQPTQENHQSPPATGEQTHVPEPAPATQSPYASPSSSSEETGASAGVPSSPKDQTANGPETSADSTPSQKEGVSKSCSYGRTVGSCDRHDHAASSDGSTGSSAITDDANTDVNNTQSTITIGGAAGGAAVLGGGCAALYFLNVGGIKTLITGVP
ncbi:secreted antigen 1 [Babesia caballi]|uniref:Secreted antigen 1 n=1 Tax=Babesia caballi TaxID=5871 RepID=A0AAV4M2C2_BABCB|nr:secreted antigen 1 [Babesia caballi]